MNRTFIEVPMFTRKWRELGLTDENLRDLRTYYWIILKLEMLFKELVV